MSKIKFKVVDKIKDEGFPVNTKYYKKSHLVADEAEKKVYGKKPFKETVKVERKIVPKGELMGTNTKSGKIKVSKKTPVKQRNEIATHEIVEHIQEKLYEGKKLTPLEEEFKGQHANLFRKPRGGKK